MLRSAAILLVLSLHVGEFFPPRVQHLPFVYYGWSGVDLFFVLSGFLIGGQLWKQLYAQGNIEIGRFILRRGYRIWPLYYAFILVVGGLTLAVGKPVRGFLVDIFCISNYFHHKIAGGGRSRLRSSSTSSFPCCSMPEAVSCPSENSSCSLSSGC